MNRTAISRLLALILTAAVMLPCAASLTGCENTAGDSSTDDGGVTDAAAAETDAVTDAVTETDAATEAVTEPPVYPSAGDFTADMDGYSRSLLAAIRSDMVNEKSSIAYERMGDKQISYLWPFSVLLEATSATYENDTSDAELKSFYRALLDRFLPRYKSKKRKEFRVYSSSTSDGDRYYDDNEWIVIELVRAYRLLGDETYLTYAKETAEFCYDGWHKDGGILWVEKGDSRNTCSNGPAAVMSCMLYAETGDEYYLDWAKKIYNWTYETLLAPDGTYFDNLKRDGSVDKAKYSYNTGTMIASGAMLYEITGEERYLDEARASAEGGFGYFLNETNGRYIVKNDNPWFNSWLLEGFIELYRAEPPSERSSAYIEGVYKALAHGIGRSGDGFYLTGAWTSKNVREVRLIDQSGTARVLAQLAGWVKEYAR